MIVMVDACCDRHSPRSDLRKPLMVEFEKNTRQRTSDHSIDI